MIVDMTAETIRWTDASWDHPPVRQRETERGELEVEAQEGSDAWVSTYYGFTHDDAYALQVPAVAPAGYEVRFRLDYDRLYDQAGIMIIADTTHWLKSGVEISDSVPQIGPYLCGPQGPGLTVTFSTFTVGQADPELHLEDE